MTDDTGSGGNSDAIRRAVDASRKSADRTAHRNPHRLYLLTSFEVSNKDPYQCFFSNPPGLETLMREGIPRDQAHTLIARGRAGYWTLRPIPWKANPGDLQQ